MPRFRYLKNYQPDPLLETPSTEAIVQSLARFNPSFTPNASPELGREYQRVRHVQIQYFVSVIELLRQAQVRQDTSLEGRCQDLVTSISNLSGLQGVQELGIIKKVSALWLGGQGGYSPNEIYNVGVQIYRAHRHAINRAKRAGKKTVVDMQRFAPSDISSRLDTPSALSPVIVTSDEFRRDIVLEQVEQVLYEIKKRRIMYAQVEARALAGIANEAKDLDTQDAAKKASNGTFGPLIDVSRQLKDSLRRPA